MRIVLPESLLKKSGSRKAAWVTRTTNGLLWLRLYRPKARRWASVTIGRLMSTTPTSRTKQIRVKRQKEGSFFTLTFTNLASLSCLSGEGSEHWKSKVGCACREKACPWNALRLWLYMPPRRENTLLGTHPTCFLASPPWMPPRSFVATHFANHDSIIERTGPDWTGPRHDMPPKAGRTMAPQNA